MKLTLLLIICLLLSGCWLFPTPEPVIEPEPIPCAELAKLAVSYNGIVLESGEVIEIPYNTKVLFEVQGLDVTGTLDACLDGGEISWGNSCSCTHWGIADGVVNYVYVNNSTLNIQRNVWVHHVGGQSFGWKVEVISNKAVV